MPGAIWPYEARGITPAQAVIMDGLRRMSAPTRWALQIEDEESLLDLSWDNGSVGVMVHADGTHNAYISGDSVWSHRTFPNTRELEEFLSASSDGDAFFSSPRVFSNAEEMHEATSAIESGAIGKVDDAFTPILAKRSKADLVNALVCNHMAGTGKKVEVVARARSGMLLGVPSKCTACHDGFLELQDDRTTYKCLGFMKDGEIQECGKEFGHRDVVKSHWQGGVPLSTRPRPSAHAWPSVPPNTSEAATSVVRFLEDQASLRKPKDLTLTSDEFDGETAHILCADWGGVHVFIHDDGEADVHRRGDALVGHREFPVSDQARLARLLWYETACADAENSSVHGASLEQLLQECDVQDLEQALKINHLQQTGQKHELINRVVSGMLWGVPTACSACGLHALHLSADKTTYMCRGTGCHAKFERKAVRVRDWAGATPRNTRGSDADAQGEGVE